MDDEQDRTVVVVTLGVPTDYEPVSIDFVDLYALFLKEVFDPVLSPESEKS